MKKIDEYSFNLGVIDCFNEMVASDVKNIALSHPFKSEKEFIKLQEGVEDICTKHGTKYFKEKDFLTTDLFPKSYTENTLLYIFYKKDEAISIYFQIKELKRELIKSNLYSEHYRKEVATCFGQLLGYSNERIEELILANGDKDEA